MRNGITPVMPLRAAGVNVAMGLDDKTINDEEDAVMELRMISGKRSGLNSKDKPRLPIQRLSSAYKQRDRAPSAEGRSMFMRLTILRLSLLRAGLATRQNVFPGSNWCEPDFRERI
jgi:hypothetical protein